MPGKEAGGNAQAVTTGREPAVEARALADLYDAPAGPAARWLLTIGTLVVAGALIEPLAARVRERAAEAEDRAQRLRTEQARTRAIIETANEAYVAVDDRGRVIDWNPAAELTFGWSRERALGSSLIDLLIPARHRKAARYALADALAQGAEAMLDRRIEIEVLHRDGREITCEATIARIAEEGTTTFSAFAH